MGLTAWKNAPRGPIRRRDVEVAKNYLQAEEIEALNRVVGMYLDYAEDQARRRRAVPMAEWADRLDAFLKFNERNILTHAGQLTHEAAMTHAHAEFDRYDEARRRREALEPTSDFDHFVEETKRLGTPPSPRDDEPGTR